MMPPGVLASAATGGHVCTHGPVAAIVCFHQKPGRSPWSGLLPRDVLLSEGCAESAPPPTTPVPCGGLKEGGLLSVCNLATSGAGRPGPEATRAGVLSLPSPASALRRAGPAPHLGSIVELTLTQSGENGEVGRQVSVGELALQLVCQAAAWARERCPPHPHPLWLAGELALPLTSCSIQESGLCTSPGLLSRAGFGCGDCGLANLVCCVVAQTRERCFSSLPRPLPPLTNGRAGELATSLSCCNTLESRPCTLPGLQGRAGPGWCGGGWGGEDDLQTDQLIPLTPDTGL